MISSISGSLSREAFKAAGRYKPKKPIKSNILKKSRENVIKPEMVEIDGPKGPEPTRYGDWERQGKASDF